MNPPWSCDIINRMERVNSPTTLDEMVDMLADAMLVDSSVVIDKHGMRMALIHDLNANGQRPLSKEDVEFLVMGENLDGTSDLEQQFPNVLDELASYF